MTIDTARRLWEIEHAALEADWVEIVYDGLVYGMERPEWQAEQEEILERSKRHLLRTQELCALVSMPAAGSA